MLATQKRHILRRNGVFWRILRQNPSRPLGCSELQEPKKTNTFLVRKVTKQIRNAWAVYDVIICADCITIAYGVWAWRGVKFWLSPLTCFVALTTLSHYPASVWFQGDGVSIFLHALNVLRAILFAIAKFIVLKSAKCLGGCVLECPIYGLGLLHLATQSNAKIRVSVQSLNMTTGMASVTCSTRWADAELNH